MTKDQRRTVTWIATVALLGGCQPAEKAVEPMTEETGPETQSLTELPPIESGPEIETGSWQLEALLGEGGEMGPPMSETTIDIQFSEGELSGSAGCNRYFGSYTLDGDGGLSISSEIGSTQMACPPPIAEQEQRYLSLLGQVALWNLETGSLVLRHEDGRALLAYGPALPASVEGAAWRATGINNGKGGVVSTASTSLSTASFVDGTVTGSGGCNNFNATYELSGDEISIGPAAATRKNCPEPEGIMDQEQQYLAALGRATKVMLSAGRLELRDEEGSLQVSFEEATAGE
ncbi:MAG: META domain-containing protein [Acidobacteriota bacterium]|jgi:heat shock protein HslJ